MKSPAVDLSGRRVLITGGTGFIGGRLVERLMLEHQANVRVLVRNFARATRIARFPIEMVHGDITSPGDVERAVDGCDLVFHCAALGSRGSREVRHRANVEGTRNVLEAALQAGVDRVVHLSSLTVYGNPPDGDLDETAPRRYSSNIYSDTKLDGEKVAFEYARDHGLPVAILQPTIVYGPYGAYWTVYTLRRLKTERVILVNGGDGFCNPVYIDDVINAMLLAAVRDEAIGEAFLISGEEPVTWRDFFERYARMIGSAEMVNMSADEILKAYRAQKRGRKKGVLRETLCILRETPSVRRRLLQTSEGAMLRRVAKSLVPPRLQESLGKWLRRQVRSDAEMDRKATASKTEKPVHLMSPEAMQLYVPKISVRIEKAKRLLGYQPAFDLESGMELTEQWAKWANLL